MEKFDKSDILRLRKAIDEADHVVITTHTAPDGDALGSSLGLAQVLELMGKEVKVIVPSTPSLQLKFLPGFKYIDVFKENVEFDSNLITRADIIFSLDYNALSRIDDVAAAVREAKGLKVMIDHHLQPENFCDITISRPEASSTCFLLFKVICALELVDAIDRNGADCMLAGMMTDTGNFSYNSNTPEPYRVVAELVARGANHDRLAKLLFDTYTESCLRLNSYAIYEKMKVWAKKGVALITLTQEELKSFHSRVGDTEGLVNRPLAIEEVRCSCFLRQEEGYVKVSMRSKGDVRVDEICSKYFNGGGHKNAAGGEFPGTIEECVARFESLIDTIHELYIKK